MAPPSITEYGQATLWEKLGILPVAFKSLGNALLAMLLAPLRGSKGSATFGKHVMYAYIRIIMAGLTKRQLHYVLPSTDQEYLNLCNRHSLKPHSFTLSDGVKVHWIGKPTAKKLFVYYHGGGFEVPCSGAHFEWMYRLNKDLNAAGEDVAVVMLAYRLTPYAKYPTQLKQAVETLRVLVEKEGRDPANVFIGGDSAGGNLSLAVLSHLNHPHPEVPELKLSGPLGGAVLISPWIDFNMDSPAYTRNANSDLLAKGFLGRASPDYHGGVRDNYSEAIRAPATWWNGLERVVKSLYVWSGSGELIIDSIRTIVKDLQSAHPDCVYEEADRAGHEDIVLADIMLRFPKQQYQVNLENWFKAKL